jgi:subtilisin family serine protease
VRSHRKLIGGLAAASALILGAAAAPVSGNADTTGAVTEYTVVAADGVDNATAAAAITRAGGTVVATNDAVGLFQVTSTDTGFIQRADAATALLGAAHRMPIGAAPRMRKPTVAERQALASATANHHPPAVGMDPLDDKLWGLRMVRADKARQVTTGDRRVTVGIIDTGIDASHPDIAPNFSWQLSRNFAKDIPGVGPDDDGPCEVPSCLDPVGTDDAGHGTHVAGTVGAAANGFGVSGVAPGVSLVELKAGQDSGFFFLEPAVNALTYAADAGIDVVNMSFFLDPWLFNCGHNPADSPTEQAEQRTIVAGISRALRYAHGKGVTLINSAGNENLDLGNPHPDAKSPDFPSGTNKTRQIDNNDCLDLPAEGPFVIPVSSVGPSGKKSDFSSYGTEQVRVSAPGGWFRDGFGTPTFRTNDNLILSAFPKKVLQENGQVDADGNIVAGNEGLVFKECTAAGRCGYFTYLQGTSMAAPHATGVAALIVSRYGHSDPRHHGGLTMSPALVELILEGTAAEHACPEPRLQTYAQEGRGPEFDAFCAGSPQFNGFYGYGVVDAYAAVTGHH